MSSHRNLHSEKLYLCVSCELWLGLGFEECHESSGFNNSGFNAALDLALSGTKVKVLLDVS